MPKSIHLRSIVEQRTYVKGRRDSSGTEYRASKQGEERAVVLRTGVGTAESSPQQERGRCYYCTILVLAHRP